MFYYTTTEVFVIILLAIIIFIVFYFTFKKCYKKLIDYEENYGLKKFNDTNSTYVVYSEAEEEIMEQKQKRRKIEYAQILYDKIHVLAMQQYKIRKGLQIVYGKIEKDDEEIHKQIKLIRKLIEQHNLIREKILQLCYKNPEYGPFIKLYITPKLVPGITSPLMDHRESFVTNVMLNTTIEPLPFENITQ